MRMIIKTVLYALAIIFSSPGYAAVTHSHEKYTTQVNKANALIQLQIGLLYEEGIGFPQNSVFARYWFEKAAEQNNADALFYLGEFYMDGYGVAKDVKRGYQLYQKAAELGSSHAMNNLGLLAKQEGNIEKAITLYKQAIASGADTTLLNLASLYQENGNYEESEKLLLVALGKKDYNIKSEALNKLGTIYSRSDYEGYDPKKAEEYYLESIKLGNDLSLNNIGVLYFKSHQYQKAFYYIKLAADKNIPGAINNLGALYKYGHGTTQDYTKALSLFKQSAAQNNSVGLFNLGSMYEKGEGVKQDDNKAIKYYEKALAAGHYPAQERIDFLKAKRKK
ncbi:tetratricopeptide repeat protein [Morganella morganii]|uniref:tetratricopeptide repeat protein n=1 Tax=Morganella morganii TaxID=582 RepID=UPI001C45B902|nr:SEL1-like repeat protein [Morganella morganii]QXO72612.1 SEL1-like repeat protein [Morganella morganii]